MYIFARPTILYNCRKFLGVNPYMIPGDHMINIRQGFLKTSRSRDHGGQQTTGRFPDPDIKKEPPKHNFGRSFIFQWLALTFTYGKGGKLDVFFSEG